MVAEADLIEGLGRRVGEVWMTLYGPAPANYGRHDNEADALREITDKLVSELDPAMIWLFGSRARGDARQDSDFDLLVVAKPHGCFGSDDYEKVDAPLRFTGIGADVVPCDLETFESSLQVPTSFVYQIVNGGRLVHGVMSA